MVTWYRHTPNTCPCQRLQWRRSQVRGRLLLLTGTWTSQTLRTLRGISMVIKMMKENNMPKRKYSRKRGEEIQCHRHKGQSSHNARSEHPPWCIRYKGNHFEMRRKPLVMAVGIYQRICEQLDQRLGGKECPHLKKNVFFLHFFSNSFHISRSGHQILVVFKITFPFSSIMSSGMWLSGKCFLILEVTFAFLGE